MHCSSCSSAVERALVALPGVRQASVALLAESAEVCLRSFGNPLVTGTTLCRYGAISCTCTL